MKANLTRFAWLSIGAAVLTIALKATAYWLTRSIGLLSDALEALVNLVAAIMALSMLTVAGRPADEIHAFGYSKAEYFSSGLEGALILLAAATIAWTAVPRLFTPQPLEQLGVGLTVSVVASAVNFGVARVLLNAGKEYRSITLEADAHHLMADVWTSAGVVLGVGVVALTGWLRLDPLIALIVAANILRTGWQLLSRSIRGLLDAALPAAEQEAIKQVLNRYESQGIQHHALRTRQAGTRSFISLHVLVPGNWTVQRGHDLLEHLERDIRAAVPGAQLFTHLEPQGDPAAWEDIALDRGG
jgi:cation diffusion facilitator family transporter